MEESKIAGIRLSVSRFRSVVIMGLLATIAASNAFAQAIEGNVNVTGSGAAGYKSGQPARQENEPSCGINPLNELNILCAYNWYGFSDIPTEQGDAWIAFSESIDGRNFKRRPLTGTKLNSPLGKEFAADPTMLVWPGGAAVTSIIGDRGGSSVMVIQRMMELNRETGFRHVSEIAQIEIASIQGSNFIDKPDAHIIITPGGGTTPVTMTLEEKDPITGENLVVTRDWPNMRIVVTFAVFNGSNENIRTYSTYNDQYGAAGAWSNPRQISNTSGLDQGLSVSSMDNQVLYTMRRFDSGEGTPSIIGAVSRDRGNRIGKVFTIADVCEFDQVTAPNAFNPNRVSARSNMFPWVSATGSHYVLAYAERPRDSAGNCLTDYSNTAGTRIMLRTSTDGKKWSDPAVPVTPFTTGPVHFQYMPTIACARGACNVVFYSTLSESQTFSQWFATPGQQSNTPGLSRHWEQNPFVEDFKATDTTLGVELYYRRSVDIFSSKIEIAGDGTPLPSEPVRVSQYQVDIDSEGVAHEIESNPINIRNYGGNTVAFSGDYNALAGTDWRRNPTSGEWESNASPIGNISDAINRVSYFAAWADNRRVRGLLHDDQFMDGASTAPLPYEVIGGGADVRNDKDPKEEEPITMLAQSTSSDEPKITEPGAPSVARKKPATTQRPDRFLSAYTRSAEGLEDPNDLPGECVPGTPMFPEEQGFYQTRIKDSEIYGATIEDRIRLVSPTVAKNLGVIQRGFVIGSENTSLDTEKTLRLVIGNQPGQTPSSTPNDTVFLTDARSSWRQLPFLHPLHPDFVLGTDPAPILDQEVTIQPLSTEYVTLFVISPEFTAPITVYAFETTATDPVGTLISQITVNGKTESGDLIDPNTTSESVLLSEIHDPEFAEPDWDALVVNELNPNFKNPNYKNPNLKNPNLKNPNWKNPNLKNTDYMDPNYKNPNLKNPNFKNTTVESTNLVNPNLKNPNLKNAAEPDSFIDVTYTVTSENNTTTAINADFAYGGDELDNLNVEVIAWETDELQTLADCDPGHITESKVVSAKSNPNLKNLAPADIENPFQGFVNFALAPKANMYLTFRIFCSDAASECAPLIAEDEDGNKQIAKMLGYNLWAQKANTGKFEINTDNEQKIKDVLPPEFNVVNGEQIRAQATDSNGALVHLVDGTGTTGDILSITATDEGIPTDVTCSLALSADPMTDPTMTAGSDPIQVPVGITGATCTATDVNNLEGTWTGTLRVEDSSAPVLYIPAPTLTVEPTSVDGTGNLVASVDYLAVDAFNPIVPGTISVTDALDPLFDDAYAAAQLLANCIPANGGTFASGTDVTCTVSDHGPNSEGGVNTATEMFTINVVDTIVPTITAPADAVIEGRADTPGASPLTILTATELGTATGMDNTGVDPTITNDVSSLYPNGFELGGPHLVTWTATDLAGNPATVPQNVTIVDTTDPIVNVPADFDETSTSLAGMPISFDVTVTEVFPDTLVCTANGATVQSGDTFPVGTTTVTCTATDTSGQSAADSFDINIEFHYTGTGVTVKKGSVKAGSSVPLSWAWTDDNGNQDVGNGNQQIFFKAGACGGADAGDPGSSGFRKQSDNSWLYNWQTDDDLASGQYCVTVLLTTTDDRQFGTVRIR